MQVKNIECQIAQAQLRRYLTGEEMPNTIVTDLETHLRHCPECMAAAQSLRESLKGVLNGKIIGKPVAEPAPIKLQAPTQALVQTPADFLDEPDSKFKPAKTPKKSTMKTLAYSGALAVLLVLMSTVFKDPTTLFGPKAAASTKDTPPAVASTAPSTTTDKEIETEPATETTPVTNVTEPATEDVGANTEIPETSKPLATSGLIVAGGSGTTEIKTEAPKKETIKPQPKPTAKKKPAARKSGSGVGTIRVYPPAK